MDYKIAKLKTALIAEINASRLPPTIIAYIADEILRAAQAQAILTAETQMRAEKNAATSDPEPDKQII